jgi:hypothetical protein
VLAGRLGPSGRRARPPLRSSAFALASSRSRCSSRGPSCSSSSTRSAREAGGRAPEARPREGPFLALAALVRRRDRARAVGGGRRAGSLGTSRSPRASRTSLRVRGLPREDVLARGLAFHYPPVGTPRPRSSSRARSSSPDQRSRLGRAPEGAVPAPRLALLPRHARARDRARPGRQAVDGRPLHVPPAPRRLRDVACGGEASSGRVRSSRPARRPPSGSCPGGRPGSGRTRRRSPSTRSSCPSGTTSRTTSSGSTFVAAGTSTAERALPPGARARARRRRGGERPRRCPPSARGSARGRGGAAPAIGSRRGAARCGGASRSCSSRRPVRATRSRGRPGRRRATRRRPRPPRPGDRARGPGPDGGSPSGPRAVAGPRAEGVDGATRLARILLRKGDLFAAERELERAIADDPSNEEARRGLDRVRELRGGAR